MVPAAGVPTTAVEPSAAAPSAMEAGTAARRITSRFTAVIVIAERPGTRSALGVWCGRDTVRLGITARRPRISFERFRCSTGPVINATAPADISMWGDTMGRDAASSAVINITVIKGSAGRVIAGVVIHDHAVMPVESPVRPTPAKSAEETYAESHAKR